MLWSNGNSSESVHSVLRLHLHIIATESFRPSIIPRPSLNSFLTKPFSFNVFVYFSSVMPCFSSSIFQMYSLSASGVKILVRSFQLLAIQLLFSLGWCLQVGISLLYLLSDNMFESHHRIVGLPPKLALVDVVTSPINRTVTKTVTHGRRGYQCMSPVRTHISTSINFQL